MKSFFMNKISRKLFSLFITAVLSAAGFLFTSCEYYNLPVKAVLYEYGTLPFFEGVKVSGSVVMDSSGYQCVSSEEACSVQFLLNNPKSKKVQMELSFPENSSITKDDYEFEVASDLKSALLTYSEEFLALIDGDTKKFSITPSLKLYYTNSLSQKTKIDSRTVRLRCNTPPAGVTNGCSMMYSDTGNGINNRLVVCFDLPDNETDVTKLTVNGRTFTISGTTYEEQTVNGWTLTASRPAGLEVTDGSGSGFSSVGNACYVITDVDEVISKNKFNISIKLTDNGGLSAPAFVIPSRELTLGSVTFKNSADNIEISGSAIPISQLEGKDYAEILVNAPEADPDAIVYCTVVQEGTRQEEKHSTGSLKIQLYPAEDGSTVTYQLFASAVKTGYQNSPQESLLVTVRSQPVTYSLYEVAADLTETEISAGGSIQITKGDHATVKIKASVSGTASERIYDDGTPMSENFTDTDTADLYPNVDGSQKTYNYTITGTKNYHTVTDKNGTLSITGRTLGDITSNTADGKLVPGDSGAVYKLTSTEEGATLTYTVTDALNQPVSVSGNLLEDVEQPNISKNPVSITLGAGKYKVTATLTKDYCNKSVFEQEITVTAAAIWISAEGNDSNAGTKAYPFATLSKAYNVLLAAGDGSSNIIYIKTDLTPEQGFNDSSTQITVEICGAKNGTIGSPVTINLSNIGFYTGGILDPSRNASGFYMGTSQNITLKNINFTTSSTASTPAKLYAAVMCTESSSSITLKNCTFSGIYARGGVSAIAVENGTVNLVDTVISGNYAKPASTTDKGKAVSVTQNGKLTLSGTVKIIDNKGLSDSGVNDVSGNLFLGDNRTAEIEEDFEAASKIGISTDKSEDSLPVTITSGYKDNPVGTFTSDDEYKVNTVSSGVNLGELQLSNDGGAEGGFVPVIIQNVSIKVYSELNSESTASNLIEMTSDTSSSAVLKYKIYAVETSGGSTTDVTSSLENISINVTPGGSATGINFASGFISIPKAIMPGTYQILISADYLDDTQSGTVKLTVN